MKRIERGPKEAPFDLQAKLGHGKPVVVKMPREFKEGVVLLPNVIENSNCGLILAVQSDNPAARAAEIALQRLNANYRRAKVALKKVAENIHG